MAQITSLSNQQIKEAVKLHQKKYRTRTGLFILEGYKAIYEAHNSGVEITTIYTTEKNVSKFDFLKEKTITVSEPVLEKLSTTESFPEAVAIGVQRIFEFESILGLKKIALLENIKDAGNLGTIIRSAAAFGIEAIVLANDTIDIYNPKVVRSAVGALFKIPVLKINDLNSFSKAFCRHNFIATVVNKKDISDPCSIDYKKPFVIFLGSEADGLTPEALEFCSIKTTIPITNKAESLNLSAAASIMFFISSNY